MRKEWMVSILLTCALGTPIGGAQGSPAAGALPQSTIGGNSDNVQVRSVVKVFLKNEAPGYSIAYDYNFPERTSVWVKDLGVVPAKGSFRYVSNGSRLEFRDGPDGKVLASVPLKETVIVAAQPPVLGLPDETSFPEDFQAFTWDSRLSLQERANSVLNKAFRYHPRRDKEVTLLKTTFTPLQAPNVATGITAQIALLLSFPYDADSNKYSLHVQTLVMEGRTHSDKFQPTSNPIILRSADDFVRSLIDQMKAGKE